MQGTQKLEKKETPLQKKESKIALKLARFSSLSMEDFSSASRCVSAIWGVPCGWSILQPMHHLGRSFVHCYTSEFSAIQCQCLDWRNLLHFLLFLKLKLASTRAESHLDEETASVCMVGEGDISFAVLQPALSTLYFLESTVGVGLVSKIKRQKTFW